MNNTPLTPQTPYTLLDQEQFIALERLKAEARKIVRLQLEAWKEYQVYKMNHGHGLDKDQPR